MAETLAETYARMRGGGGGESLADTLARIRAQKAADAAPGGSDPVDQPVRPDFVGPPEAAPHLGSPDESILRILGMKENGADREAAARELYPNAREVYRQPGDDTVTVHNPNNEILNFEPPDHTSAITNALGKLLSRAGGSGAGHQYEQGRGANPSVMEQAAGIRTGVDVHREEITPQQSRLEEENAAGALPHIATRAAANLGVGAATAGAGLAAEAAAYGVANGAVPWANRAINELSPGGDTENPLSTGWRSLKDAGMGVLATLVPGYIAGRVSENAVVNRGVDRLGHQEGVPNVELESHLAQTPETLPLQALAKQGPHSDESTMLLQKMLKNDKVQRTQGLATANVERMSQNAEGAVQSANTLKDQADLGAQNTAARVQESVRQAKNTARVARQSADESLAEQTALRDQQHTANMEKYEGDVAARNQKYATETRAHADEVAKIREADAAKKADFNKKRAKEANVRASNDVALDEEIQAAKQNYGGRYQANRIDELKAQKSVAPYKLVPPQSTPRPAAPTMDARPLKPTRQPVERPVADAYQEPSRAELHAAQKTQLEAEQGVSNAKAAQKPIEAMRKSLKQSLSRIEKAQGPSLLHRLLTGKNVVRAAGAFLTGGKTLAAEEALRAPFQAQKFLDNRAMIKLLADPTRARQMQELAAKGERLPVNDVKAVEQFAQDLRAFLAEQPESDHQQ